MLDKFNDRQYTDPGIILHVVSQMLWLSDINYISKSRDQVLLEAESYVSHLREEGRLLGPSDNLSDSPRYGSYGGLGFYGSDSPEFTEFYNYLGEQQKLAEVDRYPAYADYLLALISSDPQEFREKIAFSSENSGEFVRKPVLAAIDPKQFALAASRLPAGAYRDLMVALKARYEAGQINRDLVQEKDWLDQVRKALDEITSHANPLERDRVFDFFEKAVFQPVIGA